MYPSEAGFFTQLNSLETNPRCCMCWRFTLFPADCYTVVWMHFSWFQPPPSEGHLSGFQAWAMTSKAAMNFCVQVLL